MAYLGKWHDITVEDDVSVLMELDNGATASFITTTGDTPGTNRLDIGGKWKTSPGGRSTHFPQDGKARSGNTKHQSAGILLSQT